MHKQRLIEYDTDPAAAVKPASQQLVVSVALLPPGVSAAGALFRELGSS